MRLKSLTDVCVISEDPFFINQVKIFSQKSDLLFKFTNNTSEETAANLFLIDACLLGIFLEHNSKSNTSKFIVHGDQKDLAPAFNAGCADFLKNPWNSDELEARISKIIAAQSIKSIWDKLILSQTTLATEDFSIDISMEEYIILKKLLENKNVPVPREVLLFTLWGKPKEGSRVVDMHIANIRKKLKIFIKYDKSCCGTIKTIRSYGYMII